MTAVCTTSRVATRGVNQKRIKELQDYFYFRRIIIFSFICDFAKASGKVEHLDGCGGDPVEHSRKHWTSLLNLSLFKTST